jgi:large conductance mechanosensitive channel
MATKKDPVVLVAPPQKRSFTGGFMEFIRQYSVIPLAIAVVLGNAVNDLVKALVDGVVTPIISLFVPSTALQSYELHIKSSTFQIGAVLSALISFIVVAFIVYTFVKKVLRDDTVLEKK